MHFIRTGSTLAGGRKTYVGQTDLPLSRQGIDELTEMKREFTYPRAEMVFTSPLSRCVQTAELLYPDRYTVGLDDLKDMNLGRFEGKTFEEMKDNEDFNAWLKNSFQHTPPGGEDAGAFTKRIVRAVHDIFGRMMKDKMSSVAVVTHGGVIMTLLAGIGLPKQPLHQWAVGNGAGYTLLFTPQMWMRDGCAEVYTHLPEPPISDDMGTYDYYFNKD